LEIINQDLFTQLSATSQLPRKRYKRGCRGGTSKRLSQRHNRKLTGVNSNNLITVPITRSSKQQNLPSLFYTNSRSLNSWKLDELNATIPIHKPDIICLTETWLDAAKEKFTIINGYDGYFSHRSGRIGGGVCIFTSSNLNITPILNHTTKTISSIWIKVNISYPYPIII
jgi:hypothetical protein